MRGTILIPLVLLVLAACNVTFEPVAGGRDTSCDDGTSPSCEMVEPLCEAPLILAYQSGCYRCVDPQTCEVPVVNNVNNTNNGTLCIGDVDCPASQWCNECGAASCPGCTDCVAVCQDHDCQTQAEATCDMVRPECGADGVAVITDGCWECVNRQNCEPLIGPCGDGSPVLCDMAEPQCADHEILAVQDYCYRCVNPDTCEPWGTPECLIDADCADEERCDECGTSSCPACLDCVAGCQPHGCTTETNPYERTLRPQCEQGATAVLLDGAWHCVGLGACAPVRDSWCDDGTEIMCNLLVEPTCGELEVLAVKNGCYLCVNPVTCEEWGVAGCTTDADCTVHGYCSDCATGSCPYCEDCVAGCVAHGCETEPMAQCDMTRPDCGEGYTAILDSGCWHCAELFTCTTVSATD